MQYREKKIEEDADAYFDKGCDTSRVRDKMYKYDPQNMAQG